MTTRSLARTRDVSAPGSPGALTPDPIRDEIARLGDLDLDALRRRWRKLFRASAPPHLTRSLLLRIIAYRIQANAYGDLDRATLRFLDKIARARSAACLGRQARAQARAFDPACPGATFAQARHRARARACRHPAPGRRGHGRLLLDRRPLPQPLGGRARHHRHQLERASLLRPARQTASGQTTPMRTLRCAIYTRVPSEHGLEQEFNSLDNQREASEAYVRPKQRRYCRSRDVASAGKPDHLRPARKTVKGCAAPDSHFGEQGENEDHGRTPPPRRVLAWRVKPKIEAPSPAWSPLRRAGGEATSKRASTERRTLEALFVRIPDVSRQLPLSARLLPDDHVLPRDLLRFVARRHQRKGADLASRITSEGLHVRGRELKVSDGCRGICPEGLDCGPAFDDPGTGRKEVCIVSIHLTECSHVAFVESGHELGVELVHSSFVLGEGWDGYEQSDDGGCKRSHDHFLLPMIALPDSDSAAMGQQEPATGTTRAVGLRLPRVQFRTQGSGDRERAAPDIPRARTPGPPTSSKPPA